MSLLLCQFTKRAIFFRGISLLSTSYKTVSIILLSRLGPYVDDCRDLTSHKRGPACIGPSNKLRIYQHNYNQIVQGRELRNTTEYRQKKLEKRRNTKRRASLRRRHCAVKEKPANHDPTSVYYKQSGVRQMDVWAVEWQHQNNSQKEPYRHMHIAWKM
jgi:ATPase subunit of ABC transporter with duplicated ATPase domains